MDSERTTRSKNIIDFTKKKCRQIDIGPRDTLDTLGGYRRVSENRCDRTVAKAIEIFRYAVRGPCFWVYKLWLGEARGLESSAKTFRMRGLRVAAATLRVLK